MAHMSRLFAASGLTTVHDAQATRDQILAYQDAYRAGELRHRVYYMLRGGELLESARRPGSTRGSATSGCVSAA